MTLSVICWLWQTPGYRTQFEPAHVNALRRMVADHYADPHRFICVTNLREGFDPGVELVADREDFARVESPHGAGNPSCYRRLRLWAPDALRDFGPRFVSLDLDCVIVGDLRPLWNRREAFVIWRDPLHADAYCGSMVLATAGARPLLWQRFNPARSGRAARACGFRGSDQAWIRYMCPDEATWTAEDGVLSFRVDLRSGGEPLPEVARIVFFHGKPDPWDPEPQRLAWVRSAIPPADPHPKAARSKRRSDPRA